MNELRSARKRRARGALRTESQDLAARTARATHGPERPLLPGRAPVASSRSPMQDPSVPGPSAPRPSVPKASAPRAPVPKASVPKASTRTPSEADAEQRDERVLVMGYRQGLCRALRSLEIAHAVWHDRPLRTAPAGAPVHIAAFRQSREESRTAAAELLPLGPFSHVIAGVERAVVAASHARRVLDARRSVHTTIMRCHDKLLMKQRLRDAGIPVTDFLAGEPGNGALAYDALGPRMVIKDRTESGGRGMQVVESREQAANAAMTGRLAERFVEGTEVSVESFVRGGRVCFSNITQYVENAHVNLLPAQLPESVAESLLGIHASVVEALRITWGITHCEFYLTANGPVVGEIALRPPGGYIMELLELAYGFSAWDALVAIELGLPFRFPKRAPRAAAAIVWHPGPGRVREIRGFDRVERHPLVERATLKIREGDQVSRRAGVGEDVGHALLCGTEIEAVRSAIDELEACLKIELEASDPET